MEHYQKLDAVLKHFSKHKRFVSTDHLMSAKIVDTADEKEYLSLIQILVEQNLLETMHEHYDEKGNALPPTLYQINANGIEFLKMDSFKGMHEKEVLYKHPELRQTPPKPNPTPTPTPNPTPVPPNLGSTPKAPATPDVPAAPMNMKMVYWLGGIVVVGLILWLIFTR